VPDLAAWERFMSLLGVGIEKTNDGLFCRLDEKARSLLFVEGPADDIAWFGWEAESAEAYDRQKQHLQGLGFITHDGDQASAALRGVERFFHFDDPYGVRFEIALNQREAGPFHSEKVKHGFVTGDLGIGHLAFNSTDHLGGERFMREAMLANLSDYIYQPMPDDGMMHASFLHTNPRHHSVAYAEGLGGASKLNHFQIEMRDILDVGMAYERVQDAGVDIRVSLGQHSNDRIVSFYAQTPSPFTIEVGCGGLTIDDEDSWKPIVHDRISEWGHKFQAP